MAFNLSSGMVLEINVGGEMLGQDIVSVLHYKCGVIVGQPTSADFLVAFRAEWRGGILLNSENSYFVNTYTVKEVAGIQGTTPLNVELLYGGLDLAAGIFPDDQGAVAAENTATYVTATMRKITEGPASTEYSPDLVPAPAISEKRFKGRTAFPALPDSSTSGNDVGEPTRLALVTAGTDLLSFDAGAGLDQVPCQLVVLSKIHNGAVRAAVGGQKLFAVQPVNQYFVNSYVGSQLSRKYKGPA